MRMSLLKFKKLKIETYKPGKSKLLRFKNIIKLSANESALGVSPKVKKEINKKISLSKYPDSKSKDLRRHISNKFNVVAVPVFWIDSEDHDWNEIRAFQLLDSEFELKKISLSDRPEDRDRAAGSIVLGKEIREAVAKQLKEWGITS